MTLYWPHFARGHVGLSKQRGACAGMTGRRGRRVGVEHAAASLKRVADVERAGEGEGWHSP
jgi:hypothetical protein